MGENELASRESRGRVVIVSQTFPPEMGGNASRIGDTARHLVTEGWDVTVLAPPPCYPHGQFDRTWERHAVSEVDGIRVHRHWAWQPVSEDPSFVSRILYYLTFPLHALLWLLFGDEEFDVLVTSSPPIFTAIAAFPFAFALGIPWVVDVRDLWIDSSIDQGFLTEGSLVERISRAFQWSVLSTADRITVTTDTARETLCDRYGESLHSKTVVVPNGVDTTAFRPGPGGSDRRVVFTGNLGHCQPLEAYIRAVARLETNTILEIVGGGDREATLKEFVEELGVEDRVRFVGRVPREEIPERIRSASVGIAPIDASETLSYAVPTKAYEYMACGVPVVGTNVGELAELLRSSGGGIGVPNRPDEIASVLEHLLEDEDRREEIGRNAREHVVSNYSRRQIASQLSDTLDELVEAETPEAEPQLSRA